MTSFNIHGATVEVTEVRTSAGTCYWVSVDPGDGRLFETACKSQGEALAAATNWLADNPAPRKGV